MAELQYFPSAHDAFVKTSNPMGYVETLKFPIVPDPTQFNATESHFNGFLAFDAEKSKFAATPINTYTQFVATVFKSL